MASAGPLSAQNSAFDIRAVRDRIEKDRVRGEAAQLLGSLRPGAEQREGEAGPSADPGPGPPPPRGEMRARPPPTSGVDGRRVEPRLERPREQGAAPEAPLQELGRLAPPPGPPPPPPPPPPPLERPLGRGAAPEAPYQAVRPPVPPLFPPPTLPLPPPPLERLQGRGAAPAAPHQAFWPRGPPPYPPPLPPPPLPPPAEPPPYGPARNNRGGPEPPRRRLEYGDLPPAKHVAGRTPPAVCIRLLGMGRSSLWKGTESTKWGGPRKSNCVSRAVPAATAPL